MALATPAVSGSAPPLAGPHAYVAVTRGAAVRSERITVFGDGEQSRDFTYVADAVDATIRSAAGPPGQVYNVGGGLSGAVSLREWTQVCAEATGCPRAVASRPESHPVDVAYYVSDTARAEARFGWKPARGPRQIADDLTRWLRAGGPA